MTEILLVTHMEGDQILARHCKPLSSKATSSRRFWKVKERDFPIDNPQEFGLQKSDYVEVELPAKEAIKMAFLLFIMPLLAFLLIYQLTGFLGSTLQVLLSLGVMVGSFFIPFLLRRFGKGESHPYILKKLSLEEARETLSCDVGCAGCGGCG